MKLRLGAHCTERPEVIRINPIQRQPKPSMKILHFTAAAVKLLEYADVYASTQGYPLFTISNCVTTAEAV